MPLRFEPAPAVPDQPPAFLARGHRYAVLLQPNTLQLRLSELPSPEPGSTHAPSFQSPAHSRLPASSLIQIVLLNANPSATLSGTDPLPGRVNYFRGNDPAQWRRNIPTFAKVRSDQVYPGIDLVYYGTSQDQLEYDFIVAPGADPDQIVLAVQGADRVDLDSQGDLVITATGGQARLRKPVIYQMIDGHRLDIAGAYQLRCDPNPQSQISFQIAAYDPSFPLIIDPILDYATYLGGSEYDLPGAIAVDDAGNVYLTGYTSSADFPTVAALDGTLHDSDAFVVKLKADGSALEYATYFGGNSGEAGAGIALDTAGNAYVTGYTWGGSDFPLVNAFQSSHGGVRDAFVAKFSADGSSLLFSTFLGGSGDEQGRDIAVDSAGRAHVAGLTSSANFPVSAGALQSNFGGVWDVFVTKFSPDGQTLDYSTYLGGTGDEFNYVGPNIELNPAGQAIVAGLAGSTNFPTTADAFQPAFGGGGNDAFVARLTADGTGFVYSTYLGGEAWDASGGYLAVDAEGCAYVADGSASANFPLEPAPLSHTADHPSLFTRQGLLYLAKLAPDGASLRFSVRLPGEWAYGIAVDRGGHAWVAGDIYQFSSFTPVDPVQPTYGGGHSDAVVVKVAPDGDALLFSSYFGGSAGDGARGIATDGQGHVYLVGQTASTNLPTLNPLQPALGSDPDAFIVKFSDPDTTPPALLAAGNYGDANIITVNFSEALDPVSATNTANYALDHGVAITAAAFGVNSRTVRLVTSGLTPGATYTLSVSNVRDRAPTPNAIAAGATVEFTALNLYRGFVRQENYSGIQPAGDLVAFTDHAKFPSQPDVTTTLHEFEIVANAYYQDGLRLSGWLLPPVSGDYTFYLCNVSQAALYLSRDASPLNTFKVAFEPFGFAGTTSGGPRAWNHIVPGWNGDPQPHTSLPIHLEAGQAYYIEVLATSSAANTLGLAWQMPGQPVPRDGDPPIPAAHLALLGDPTAATVAITGEPDDASVTEGDMAAFSIKATASQPNPFFQWRRNGVDIPGANATSYLLHETTLADHDALFDCVITVPGAAAITRAARLTVTADAEPPRLLSAEGNVSNGHVTLKFSEPISFADATNTAHYSLSGGLVVSDAVLLADRRTVVLTTSAQAPGAAFTVQVSGIRDRSAAPNTIASGAETSFFGWVDEEFVGPFPSWANVKEDYGAVGDGVADDTDAIQSALEDVAKPGKPTVIYFPSGTYRITRTLHFFARGSATLAGEDPTTTILKWDGPADTDMMFANGVVASRWTRLTWDGSGTARVAVHHGHTGGGFQVTANQHSDEIFRDLGGGLLVDPVNGGDTHLILRCHFLRCSIQGIAVSSYNAIDWHIWDSVFEDCRYGLRSYVGNFHVYRSLFLRSTEMDIFSGTGYTGIRGNLSIGSKAFTDHYIGYRATIQGNTIVDALDSTPIRWPAAGSVILLDNTIVNRADATEGPAVRIGDNLTSVGNTFTVSRPIAVSGRSIQIGDRVVSRDEVGLAPVMIPRFLPRSSSPIIEVPPGANATTIQQAIDTAAALNGQRPIVHLPTGRFDLDRTLIIPANCDLQLVGDGFDLYATTLMGNNRPGEPVILLQGPSRATLRDFNLGGTGAGHERALGSGIVIENCDQPGARVSLEQVYLSFALKDNLVVNQLDHTDVSARELVPTFAFDVGVRVIGGHAQAAGEPTAGRVVLVGGGTGGGNLTYQVENHGRLMAQDVWYEGGPGLFRLRDSGTFTLNNANTALKGDPSNPQGSQTLAWDNFLSLEDFRGQVSLLNHNFTETSIRVAGNGSETELLLLGSSGFPLATDPPLATCLDNQSPNARVEYWLSSAGGRQIPHGAEPDPVFLGKMLEQVRTETPRHLVPLPSGVTDVRIYRVSIAFCKYNLVLSGSNTPPVLPPLPIQYADELSEVVVTNLVTGPDAPYNLYAFTFGAGVPAGMTIDSNNGQIRWTPTEAQGPSTNEIAVVATAIASPLLRATNVVTVVIHEVNQPPELLPDRQLQGADVGQPPDAGSTTYLEDGSIEVVASGYGTYWGDDFHFAREQIDGDFDIGVEVHSLDAAQVSAAAGLMARVSLDRDSLLVGFYQQRPGSYAWWPEYRAELGVNPSLWRGMAGDGSRFPTWLRLQRSGQTFRAWLKYEDTAWQQVDELVFPVPLPSRLYVGLCTWPRDSAPGEIATAVFRNYRNYPTEVSHLVADRTVSEGEPVIFQALARDSDVPSILTFSLDPGAPEGATLDPVTGLFNWTPTEAQGPGVYPITVRVTDNGEPPLSDALTFTVTVHEVNAAPLLTVADHAVDEMTEFVYRPVASDPDLPTNTLQFELVSGPSGAALDPTTGEVRWAPDEADGFGVFEFIVKVADDGTPALSATRSFTVTVREVNRAPQFEPISDLVRDEGTPITFTTQATDPDWPANGLAFSLEAGAPEGARIDAATGVFTWAPTEAQGPGAYPITVRVTDNGEPPLSDALTFTVTVSEVNSAPVLQPVDDQTIEALQPLSFAVTATDIDIPSNVLALSVNGLPDGADFDPATGQFVWIPAEAQAPGLYPVTFTATDDGVPPLSSTETLTITVTEPARPVTLAGVEISDGQFRFTFTTQPGRSYLVQAKTDLEDPVWMDVQVLPAGPTPPEFIVEIEDASTRYYRVLTLE